MKYKENTKIEKKKNNYMNTSHGKLKELQVNQQGKIKEIFRKKLSYS